VAASRADGEIEIGSDDRPSGSRTHGSRRGQLGRASGADRDRTGDLLLAKRPLARPISALKGAGLQGFTVTCRGAKIGA